MEFEEILRAQRRHAILTVEEECDAFVRFAEAKRANAIADRCQIMAYLVEHNQRLVYSIAIHHCGRGLELNDLIQEGNIGLMRAIERFDPARGNKLSTFATLHVRQAIARAIEEQAATIRMPVHIAERRAKMRRVYLWHLTRGERLSLVDLAARCGYSEAQARRALAVPYVDMSLDTPLSQVWGGDPDAKTFGDTVVGDEPDPLAALAQKDMRCEIRAAIDQLDPRERELIEMRHDQELSLREIGRRIGLTSERVRQILEQIYDHLRACLADYEGVI